METATPPKSRSNKWDDAINRPRRAWISALWIVAAVFILYSPALDFGFVWDDNLYVVRNTAVHDWSRAAEAFVSPRTTWTADSLHHMAAWRPLRNISYLVDYSLFGLNPIGYHLHNIVLHAAGAVLLYFLLRRLFLLFGRRTGNGDDNGHLNTAVDTCCYFAALFWALHPAQTEVVAWVKSRDDLLAVPLFFGALLLALPRGANLAGARPVALFFAVLCYAGALLSKENAIVFAAILPSLLFGRALGWFGPANYEPPDTDDAATDGTVELNRGEKRSRLRYAFWVSFAAGIMSLGYLALRDVMLGRTAQASYPGNFSETLLTMASAFTRYVRLVLWPFPPTVQLADYDAFPIIHSWLNPGSIAGIVILISLFVLADGVRRVLPIVAIGIGFFLVAILPFSNIVPMMQIMAERFLYLPLAGCAIVYAGVLIALRPWQGGRAVGWIMILITLALAFATWRRLPVWKSERSLFSATRAANPASWRPANQYVRALLVDGQTSAALSVAEENLRHWPGDPDIVRTAAITNMLAGDEPRAAELTSAAMRLQPEDSRASVTLETWRRSR